MKKIFVLAAVLALFALLCGCAGQLGFLASAGNAIFSSSGNAYNVSAGDVYYDPYIYVTDGNADAFSYVSGGDALYVVSSGDAWFIASSGNAFYGSVNQARSALVADGVSEADIRLMGSQELRFIKDGVPYDYSILPEIRQIDGSSWAECKELSYDGRNYTVAYMADGSKGVSVWLDKVRGMTYMVGMEQSASEAALIAITEFLMQTDVSGMN